MSIWNYIFDTEWSQRADIEELKRQQRRSKSHMQNMYRQATKLPELEEMRGDIGELALFCRTAIALMVEKGIITQDEFLARMKQIDLEDGVEDGQHQKPR